MGLKNLKSINYLGPYDLLMDPITNRIGGLEEKGAGFIQVKDARRADSAADGFQRGFMRWHGLV